MAFPKLDRWQKRMRAKRTLSVGEPILTLAEWENGVGETWARSPLLMDWLAADGRVIRMGEEPAVRWQTWNNVNGQTAGYVYYINQNTWTITGTNPQRLGVVTGLDQ